MEITSKLVRPESTVCRTVQLFERLAHVSARIPSRHRARANKKRLITGPLLIITAIAALLGISTVSILFQKELASTFLFLFTSMPRFEVLEIVEGTPTSALYEMYTNFRTISFFVMSIAIIMAGLSFGLESVNLVPPKLGSKILGNGMLYLIIIMIFPYFWDMIADMVEWTSLWILNPNDPTLAHETITKLLAHTSPGVYPTTDYAFLFGSAGDIITNVAFSTIVDAVTGQDSNALEAIGESYQRKITVFLTEVLLFVFKAIALLTMSLTAFLLGTVRYVLTGLLAVAVPIILALSLIPQFNRITSLMRDTLVALMVVPIFSALAVAAGVAVLDDLERGEFGASSILSEIEDVDSSTAPPALQELTYGVRKFFMALAVLVLAIYFPAMLAPMITSVMSSVQQHISTAGIAGSVIASGTQAAITRSAPAAKWSAGQAYNRGARVTDTFRHGRDRPKGNSNKENIIHGGRHSAASQSSQSSSMYKVPIPSQGSTSSSQSQEQRKKQSQKEIASKGRPKLPKGSGTKSQ